VSDALRECEGGRETTMSEESLKRLKALPRVELEFNADAPCDSPFPDGWTEDPSHPWIGPKPTTDPRAIGADVETKMAVHFAHDARDPDILKRLAREKIARSRSGLEYQAVRLGEDDERERGAFPADKLAFGDLDAFREALVADMMAADETLSPDDALAKAMDVLNPRNLRIANSHWSRWRQLIKGRRHKAKCDSDPEWRPSERQRIAAHRKAHPEKAASASRKSRAKKKQAREALGPRSFVAIDSEGFDTSRYFSRAHVRTGIEAGLFGETPEAEKGPIERDREWYLNAHSDPQHPNARNKTFAGDIYREHKTFLWGAGDDEKCEWLCRSVDGAPKTALESEEILDWIVGLKKKFSHHIFVSYAFSYDATQILADLDCKTAVELQREERRTCSDEEWEAMSEEERERHIEDVKTVFRRGFAISYRKGKMFKVGKLRNPNEPYKFTPCKNTQKAAFFEERGMPALDRAIDYAPGGEPVTINDAFGFFQSSFVDALDGMKIDMTPEELRLLLEGKRSRRELAAMPLSEVERYTGIELIALARMMEKLRRGLNDLGLSVQRWQGAGAIAEAMFKRYRTTHYSPYVATRDISGPQEFAHHAFFGGRIELPQQGKHNDGLFAYDVTSAYPAEMASLPAMALPIYEDEYQTKVKGWKKGKWSYLPGKKVDRAAIERMSAYSIIELKFDFPSKVLNSVGRACDVPFFPLPYRTGKDSILGEGAILFPSRGWGRYYRAEALAAYEWLDKMCGYVLPAHRAQMISIECAYRFDPPRDKNGELVYPYAFLMDYYEERRRIAKGAEAKGEYDVKEKVIKLGINSVYGKMAQGVGGTKGRAPRSSNPWVAGAITAGTRAKLLRAASKAPWDVVFFATDGLHSLEDLGVESPTKTLGGWEKSTIEAGIWAQPGVYAFSSVGERQDQAHRKIARNVSRRVLRQRSGRNCRGRSRQESRRTAL
jgi:hypothetical protein